MSGKNQFPITFNWQSTDPAVNFNPNPNQNGSVPSGQVGGSMSGTSTIYTQIIDTSRMDNVGLEITYAGTGTGTITVLGSSSGNNFYSWSPSPSITQPAGSSGGCLTGLNQFPFKYMYIKYTNSSGSGTLTIYGQMKDLN